MSHPTDIHVGNKLKNLRILRSLTQTDVAKHLEISFQQVQKYELGRNRISASKLQEMALCLSVTAAYFFEGLPGSDAPDAPLLDPEIATAAALFNQIQCEHTRQKFSNLIRAVVEAQHPQQIAAE